MDRQRVFNDAAVHLLTQMKKSQLSHDAASDTICAYRGAHGMKCAIGALIPDDQYFERLDSGAAVLSDAVKQIDSKYGEVCGLADSRFLEDLQILHDRNEPDEWLDCLRTFAARYSLSSDVLLPFENALLKKQAD